MKKWFALILAVALLLCTVLTACSNSPAGPTAEETSPNAEETGGPTPISFALPLHSMDTPNMEGMIWKEIEKATNTKLTAELWEPGTEEERCLLMLTSGKLPDLSYVSRIQANAYGNDGMFIPLDDLIDEYAPHIKALLEESESTALRNPNDGKIYNIGKYTTLALGPEACLIYRKDILDEMGETEPTTMEEWYDLFVKVKEQYPDMIPLTAHSGYLEGNTYPSWDMGRVIGMHGVIGSEFDKGSRDIVYLPITDQWKEMLQYFNRLYTEKLLDREYLTNEWTAFWNNKMVGGRAFACWTLNFARADLANDEARQAGLDNILWYTAETPINSVGKRVQYKVGDPWGTSGFSISSDCKDPVAAIKFMDWLFTEDAVRLLFYGIEGVDYTINAEGEPERVQPFPENEKMRFEEGYLFNLPSLSPIEDSGDYTNLNYTLQFDKNTQYVTILPTLSRMEETTEEYTNLTTDLDAYYAAERDKFITGLRSFDEWDEYVETARTTYKADRATEIVQEWMDNYYKLADQ